MPPRRKKVEVVEVTAEQKAEAEAVKPLIDFSNNEVQRDFVFSDNRKTAAIGSIRGGKTWGGSGRLMMISDLMPGSRFLVGRRDFNDLFNTTLKELLNFVSARNGGDWKTPGPYVDHYDGQFHDLYIRTKGEPSVWFFRHLKEVGKQLGMETSGYFIDQFEEIDEEVYEHIISRKTWWNASRREEFRLKYGFYPKDFEMLTCNPDPGWVRGFLFEQEDQNSKYYTDPRDRWSIFNFDIENNRKNLAPGYIEEMERRHSKAWVERFLRGSWDIKGGQIYEEFNENVHVIDPIPLRRHWLRFLALDWGYDHPACALWGAVDERGTLYIYDELYGRKRLVSEFAADMHRMTKGHNAAPKADDEGGLLVWMDPSTDQHHGIGSRSVMGEFREHKIYGMPANNSVDAGINKVAERLKYDFLAKPPVNPSLYIFRKCVNLTRGMKLYVAQPANSAGISTGKPVKKDDDAVDALRYLTMAVLEAISGTHVRKRASPDDFSSYVFNKHMIPRAD